MLYKYYPFNLHDKSLFPKYFLYNCFLQDVIDKQKTFSGEKLKEEILHVLAATWKFTNSHITCSKISLHKESFLPELPTKLQSKSPGFA